MHEFAETHVLPASDDRAELLGAVTRSGGMVGVTAGRAVHDRWPWSIERERGRIGGCESTVTLAWDGAALRPVVFRCGSRLCPVCFAARAGRSMHRWGPVLDAALAGGAAVWHVTLTQRCTVVPGSAVLPRELGRWEGTVPRQDRVTSAVAGESAFEAYERWLTTWRAIQQARWGRALGEVGYLRGIEWTLRSGGRSAPRRQAPRWHCHGHVLVVARSEEWDPRPLLEGWARLSGVGGHWSSGVHRTRRTPWVRYGAQYAERILARDGLLEVLKYPFKPGDLTVCALLDAWAALRGARTHQPAGALHGSSRAAAREPWATWLGARNDEAPWALVEYRPAGVSDAPWAMVTQSLRRLPDALVELRIPLEQRPDDDPLRRDYRVLGTFDRAEVVSAIETHPVLDPELGAGEGSDLL